MIRLINKISKSNYVLIFSDFTRNVFSKRKFDKMISNSSAMVKNIIEKNYTVVIPTYNFKFPKNKITSDSPEFITSGYFAKHLIKNFKFKRTNRPMYNYAVIGKNSKKIISLKQSSAWGEDSVISYLTKKNAIGVGINVDIENFGWVVIHSAEEKFKVPYRYFKIFNGINLDNKKKVSEKMYVRNFKTKLTTNSYKLYKKLKPKIKYYNHKTYKISLINLNVAYKESCNFLSKNLYSLTKYEKI
tara:strand:+ start:54372 stop:55103 length:732 start_codon:yes stop_codon:yes gene_type:complete